MRYTDTEVVAGYILTAVIVLICARARMWAMGPACLEGQAAYGEYCAAFEANRDCEHLTATEANQ